MWEAEKKIQILYRGISEANYKGWLSSKQNIWDKPLSEFLNKEIKLGTVIEVHGGDKKKPQKKSKANHSW